MTKNSTHMEQTNEPLNDAIVSAVDQRYSQLAESACCLSCGGAVNHANPQLGEICVDLGGGRGHDVIRMAALAGDAGFAYGVDISAGMIQQARKNAEKLGVSNVRFIQAELHNTQLPDQTADLVISNCTINHAPDKPAVWREIHRILKPGGRFTVSDIYSLEPVPTHFAADPRSVAECWAGASTRDVYLDTLQKTGFINIRIIEESAPYDKGEIKVASFTIMGWKKKSCCCKM